MCSVYVSMIIPTHDINKNQSRKKKNVQVHFKFKRYDSVLYSGSSTVIYLEHRF